jgi:hypothetical protein
MRWCGNTWPVQVVWEHVACRGSVGTRGLSSTTLFSHITQKQHDFKKLMTIKICV